MRRSVDEHLEVVLGRVTALPAFDQPLMDAVGLMLCEDIVSGVSLPGFDNSAMDGYAVQAGDLDGASDENPIRLPVVGEFRAGRSEPIVVTPGTCVRIMTGAPMPRGAGQTRIAACHPKRRSWSSPTATRTTSMSFCCGLGAQARCG